MDLLWIIENPWSENLRNEHLRGNLQIECPNEIPILQFICQCRAPRPRFGAGGAAGAGAFPGRRTAGEIIKFWFVNKK